MFWVFFDTATKPEYYQDVHNVLALPRGAAARYDYRDEHISQSALEYAAANQLADALIVYTQPAVLPGQGNNIEGALPIETSIFIPTRLARVRSILERGDRFEFELEMCGYPAAASETILPLMQLLGQDRPLEKWVATAEQDNLIGELQTNDDHDAWSAIVDRLGVAPVRFAGDSFWRLIGVKRANSGAVVEPQWEPETDAHPKSGYDVKEQQQLRFIIEARTPANTDPAGQREINIEAPKDGPLSSLDGLAIELRRNFERDHAFEVKATEAIRDQEVVVTLTTTIADNRPMGPKLALTFRVTKSYLRLLVAIALLLFFVGFAAAGIEVGKENPLSAGVLAAASVLSGIGAWAIGWGKLVFSASGK